MLPTKSRFPKRTEDKTKKPTVAVGFLLMNLFFGIFAVFEINILSEI